MWHLISRGVQVAFGAVVWTVLSRAELAVYLQAFQRKARAPRIIDCKTFDAAIPYIYIYIYLYMGRRKCWVTSVEVNRPFELVRFIDVVWGSV